MIHTIFSHNRDSTWYTTIAKLEWIQRKIQALQSIIYKMKHGEDREGWAGGIMLLPLGLCLVRNMGWYVDDWVDWVNNILVCVSRLMG